MRDKDLMTSFVYARTDIYIRTTRHNIRAAAM